MTTFFVIFGYIIIGSFLYFVLEPWLRLRKNILLAKCQIDQQFIRVMGSIFWPAAFPMYLLCRFIIFPLCRSLVRLSDCVDKYWESKPIHKRVETIIDEAQTDYRNIKFKN